MIRSPTTIAGRPNCALSLPQAVELFETAHYRLFALLAALTPEQWNGYVRAWVMGSTWHHFEEHAAHIRAWRATQAVS